MVWIIAPSEDVHQALTDVPPRGMERARVRNRMQFWLETDFQRTQRVWAPLRRKRPRFDESVAPKPQILMQDDGFSPDYLYLDGFQFVSDELYQLIRRASADIQWMDVDMCDSAQGPANKAYRYMHVLDQRNPIDLDRSVLKTELLSGRKKRFFDRVGATAEFGDEFEDRRILVECVSVKAREEVCADASIFAEPVKGFTCVDDGLKRALTDGGFTGLAFHEYSSFFDATNEQGWTRHKLPSMTV